MNSRAKGLLRFYVIGIRIRMGMLLLELKLLMPYLSSLLPLAIAFRLNASFANVRSVRLLSRKPHSTLLTVVK